MTEGIVRFKDFSTSPEPVTFTIAPDTFVCLTDIPMDVMVELAQLRMDNDDKVAQFARIHDFFDFVLEPESAVRFRQRTALPTPETPNKHPIGMKSVVEVLQWMMEVYGLRPTQPSSESADGSANEEASSTDGASVTESIS